MQIPDLKAFQRQHITIGRYGQYITRSYCFPLFVLCFKLGLIVQIQVLKAFLLQHLKSVATDNILFVLA